MIRPVGKHVLSNGRGTGAHVHDAGQAAGRNRAVQQSEPDKRNWGSFGTPVFFRADSERQTELNALTARKFRASPHNLM